MLCKFQVEENMLCLVLSSSEDVCKIVFGALPLFESDGTEPERLLVWVKLNSVEQDGSGSFNGALLCAGFSVFRPHSFIDFDPLLLMLGVIL